MNQVLLATVIVLLVIIILRQPQDPYHAHHARGAPAGFASRKRAVTHPILPKRPAGKSPREERFPEMSVLEERHMGPDSLIDMAYAGSDSNSIYDEFTTQNM